MQPRMSAFEHYERGLVLRQVRMFQQALEEFRQAGTDPQHAGKAHVQIALCLRSTGRHEEAVASFHQALRSARFSAKERLHILYLLGQTLESLGRYAETLEAYRCIRREDPAFLDVSRRVRHLTSGGLGPVPTTQPPAQSWLEKVSDLGRRWGSRLAPQIRLAWQSLGRYAMPLPTARRSYIAKVHGTAVTNRSGSPLPVGRSIPGRRGRLDKRRDPRIPIRLRSHFSSKNRTVVGDGELRDLSLRGCRVTSPVSVPVGAQLECCIFPQDDGYPFTIEGATVRWSHAEEFGLAFTNVRPNVQRQIAQLCRVRMPVGQQVNTA